MKKVLVGLIALVLVVSVAGCEKVKGKYKEGSYTGSTIDTYNGENNETIAKIVVDANGMIESVYLDTVYQDSTKKTLKDDYNMKKFNPSAAGEWYEQVEKLEKAVVDNQGIDFLNLNEDGKTDAVSGCTIKIDALVRALENALVQAK